MMRCLNLDKGRNDHNALVRYILKTLQLTFCIKGRTFRYIKEKLMI